MITIYHKSSCSTSNKVLGMLKESKKKYKVIEYIKTPLNAEEIKQLLVKLGLPAEAIIRKKEVLYKEQYAHKKLTEEACIQMLVEHPNLIERPILVKRSKGIIGRPPEKALEWINS
jgi:arsenate reductase